MLVVKKDLIPDSETTSDTQMGNKQSVPEDIPVTEKLDVSVRSAKPKTARWNWLWIELPKPESLAEENACLKRELKDSQIVLKIAISSRNRLKGRSEKVELKHVRQQIQLMMDMSPLYSPDENETETADAESTQTSDTEPNQEQREL